MLMMLHMNQHQMRSSLILLLPFVIFPCFGQVAFAQLQRLHPNEADALRQIATTLGATLVDSTDDPCQSGKLSISTANSSNIVNSIACNYTDGTFSHVTSLKLKSMSLQGRLPPELVKLTFLQEIDLYQNYLSGELPKEWASMQHLNFISVTATGISGEIPKEWGNFANLTYLSLEANQLSGSIPEELGNLVSLTELALSSNQFVGSLPKTLANLANLTDFRISDNSFNGTVPEFIGRWTKLKRLEMYSSGLEGPISPTIFALGNLTDLRITDMIGPKFDFPKLINKNMEQLVLRNLNMSGSIPTYIWDMGELKTLDLTFNELKGEINSSTTSPTYLFLSGNMLNGTIPNPFLTLKDNKNLDLSYNNFTLSTDSCSDERPNINMYRSFTSKNNTNGHFSCPSTPSCSNYQSFHINCGGQDVFIKQTLYEGDHAGNRSILSYNRQTNWGMISVGDFMDTEKNGYTLSAQTQVTQPELYSTARGSPLFLTYYGYCLENGKYKVELHFAEIGFRDEEPYNKAGRRIFDIYIQGTLKWKDFNIKEQANGTGKAIIKTINTMVTDNTLDIRLYWAGKGTTCIPYRGYYGPLISAISVTRERKKKSILYIVVGVVASVLCLIFSIMVFFFWRRYSRNKRRRRDLKGLDLQTSAFTFKQLKAATDNFNSANKLGEGGFGAVYKGQLLDGTIIAVKQLSSKSRQGNRSQLLLVYEYMENNCLAHALFGKQGSETSTLKLDWETRQKICVGIARAKLKEEDDTHISTGVAGTVGYMAPEYVLWGHLTEKADVYSFGVLALEIASGRNNANSRAKKECVCLLEVAFGLQQNGNLMEIMDPKLEDKFNKEEAERMIKVGLLCSNADPVLRPTMSEAVSMLEAQITVQEVASDPSIYGHDLQVKQLKGYYQQKHDQSSSGSSAPNYFSERSGVGSSTTSAHDLYPSIQSPYMKLELLRTKLKDMRCTR
ncbi:hypothetical protein QYF36_006810 [Acer negundo]|nr:hypothetical protein QYF36_006810 [Acer negundo]